jgi:hypothetical protein
MPFASMLTLNNHGRKPGFRKRMNAKTRIVRRRMGIGRNYVSADGRQGRPMARSSHGDERFVLAAADGQQKKSC